MIYSKWSLQSVTNGAFLCSQNSLPFQTEDTESTVSSSIGLMLALLLLTSEDVSF